jgi:hypothetical protein
MSSIPLADVIKELREELAGAIEAGKEHEIRFKPGPIEIELAMQVEKEASGKGGVRFWVVELGGDIKAGQVQSHKIKLSLQLVDSAGREVLIRDVVRRRPGG